jgi:hypothetical protein
LQNSFNGPFASSQAIGNFLYVMPLNASADYVSMAFGLLLDDFFYGESQDIFGLFLACWIESRITGFDRLCLANVPFSSPVIRTACSKLVKCHNQKQFPEFVSLGSFVLPCGCATKKGSKYGLNNIFGIESRAEISGCFFASQPQQPISVPKVKLQRGVFISSPKTCEQHLIARRQRMMGGIVVLHVY